jgi:2'-5' RNA ligase
MLRTFIAIDLPINILEGITEYTAELREMLPKPLVRWVSSRNIHLTLKFLGDVEESSLQQLADNLVKVTTTYRPFSLSVSGIVAFPSKKRPRVIWIGLEAPPALNSMQKGLDVVLTQLGYTSENRTFSPHLTIGRVGQGINGSDMQKIQTLLKSYKVGFIGTVVVKTVKIFKSDLRPGGAVYTGLYSLPLKEVGDFNMYANYEKR